LVSLLWRPTSGALTFQVHRWAYKTALVLSAIPLITLLLIMAVIIFFFPSSIKRRCLPLYMNYQENYLVSVCRAANFFNLGYITKQCHQHCFIRDLRCTEFYYRNRCSLPLFLFGDHKFALFNTCLGGITCGYMDDVIQFSDFCFAVGRHLFSTRLVNEANVSLWIHWGN